jgi:hypothetical protein
MEGFEIELKHGIRLMFHAGRYGQPFPELIDMLEQIKRESAEGRSGAFYCMTGGGTGVRLARKKGDPAPTNDEWLDLVGALTPVVQEIKRKRGGVKTLHDRLRIEFLEPNAPR